MPKKGFTLIELLVVVAIIASLVAMLLPALNMAREQSKSLDCINRLKSIGSASQFYFLANNDQVPTDTWKYPLRVCLNPYLKAYDRYYWESSVNWSCPKAPHTKPIPITISYGMNYGVSLGTIANPWVGGAGFRLSLVDHARFIWVSETGRKSEPNFWEWTYDEDDSGVEPTWNRWRDGSTGLVWNLWTVVLGPPWAGADMGYPFVAFRHRGKANTLFLDGHVKSLSIDDMMNYGLWLRE